MIRELVQLGRARLVAAGCLLAFCFAAAGCGDSATTQVGQGVARESVPSAQKAPPKMSRTPK